MLNPFYMNTKHIFYNRHVVMSGKTPWRQGGHSTFKPIRLKLLKQGCLQIVFFSDL